MQASAEKIWGAAQEHLRSMLSADTYNLWFAPLRACAQENNSITLEVANDFCEVWLKDNYMGLLQDVMALASGRQLQVKFKVGSGSSPAAPAPQPAHGQEEGGRASRRTNRGQPRAEFQSEEHVRHVRRRQQQQFRLRRRAGGGAGARQVLQPAVPLRRRRSGQDPSAARHRPACRRRTRRARGSPIVSSEKFTNEYIDGIQNNQLARFRKKYRQTDVLLIDDIQFLAGKERIQEEFFHTFNALHEAHKQIVLTCDRPASEIQNLEHRLVSRFEWGLVTDLQPPDVEMRLAILQKKAQIMGVQLPEEIMNFLANRIRTNIRRLEGALIRVASYAALTGKKLSLGDGRGPAARDPPRGRPLLRSTSRSSRRRWPSISIFAWRT